MVNKNIIDKKNKSKKIGLKSIEVESIKDFIENLIDSKCQRTISVWEYTNSGKQIAINSESISTVTFDVEENEKNDIK